MEKCYCSQKYLGIFYMAEGVGLLANILGSASSKLQLKKSIPANMLGIKIKVKRKRPEVEFIKVNHNINITSSLVPYISYFIDNNRGHYKRVKSSMCTYANVV